MSAWAGVITPDRGDPSAGGYVSDDALTQRTHEVALPRNPVRAARRAAVQAGGTTSGDETAMFEETTPTALAARLATGDTPVLLDAHAEHVGYCQHGGRSAMAAQCLRSQGFARVTNLAGGIDAWSVEVDASVPRD